MVLNWIYSWRFGQTLFSGFKSSPSTLLYCTTRRKHQFFKDFYGNKGKITKKPPKNNEGKIIKFQISV